ncbi:unnamed protein product [Gongylonema pulchrum]|uniref:NUC153 domain-containing protein n=1 Tax=Gongylonema pulchrum TaxID=637853 RepID=A0A183EJD3_9BILA|nr:unnamed protein product [Gongylonema pulchrum]
MKVKNRPKQKVRKGEHDKSADMTTKKLLCEEINECESGESGGFASVKTKKRLKRRADEGEPSGFVDLEAKKRHEEDEDEREFRNFVDKKLKKRLKYDVMEEDSGKTEKANKKEVRFCKNLYFCFG